MECGIEAMGGVEGCPETPDLQDTTLTCEAVDASEFGLQLVTGVPFPPHTRLSLRLDFGDELFRLDAIVRWLKGNHVGLLPDDMSQDIDAWVSMFFFDEDYQLNIQLAA